MFRASTPARPTATQLSTVAAALMVALAVAVIVVASWGGPAPVVLGLALAALVVRPCAVAIHRRRVPR